MEFDNLVTIKEKGCQWKKRIRKTMKTHESNICLLSTYCWVVATIMQQLLSYTYRHLQTWKNTHNCL
jgi:hypothetical protein